MNKINIAIDGFSGCGKSTLAKSIAESLGYTFIDTGAMFRAISLLSLRNEGKSLETIIEECPDIDFDAEGSMRLNGENVSSDIRSSEVTRLVSGVATNKAVRAYLKGLQSTWIEAKGIVMEGRDITSVIMPNAELKLFITADPDERAKRRQAQLAEQGRQLGHKEVLHDLLKRDEMDMNRESAPLIYVKSSIILDTTNLNRDEQLKAALALANPLIDPSRYLGDIKTQ